MAAAARHRQEVPEARVAECVCVCVGHVFSFTSVDT
jgi:hypothetical protein